ncbi:hypothetical protein OA331_04180 [Bacteroidota bacterium]|nr:hypothetical protein [Bacteroidota bacterium]
MKTYYKLILEAVAIIGSVLFSFYIEDLRKKSDNLNLKNTLIGDLIETIDDDLEQLNNIQDILFKSEQSILELLNDIDKNHTQINDIVAIEKILSIEVGFSFFQKDGIFNELISTGSFELIENRELKNTLLEIFNHLKERNIATSKEIDNFNIIFRREINSNFRIRFTYNSFDGKFYGSRKLINSKFNKNYYLSNSFYGAISQAQQYVNMYSRLLRDLEDSYKTALSLSKEERNNFEE